MRLARKLEHRLERVLDGLAGRLFLGRLHASELAARLVREADLAEFASPAGPATANHFRLVVNPADLRSDPRQLTRQLEDMVSTTISERGWRLEGPVTVDVVTDPNRRRRGLSVEATIAPGEIAAWGRLSGPSTHYLRHNRSIVGRAASCDVRIDSEEVSRSHALVYREGGRVLIRDLGSANGTTVNGSAVGSTPKELTPGSSVKFAGQTYRFEPCRN